MTIPLAHLRERAQRRPPGYFEHVTSFGTIEGDTITIPDDVYAQLCDRYRNGPTLTELASNFTSALKRWLPAGAPTAPESVFQQRLAICTGCPYWDKSAALKYGRCAKCGCYRMKLHLATEQCPLDPPKWSRLDESAENTNI